MMRPILRCLFGIALMATGKAAAQSSVLCIPGTPLCARAGANSGAQLGGSLQGQVSPSGTSLTTSGSANGNAAANANAASGVNLGGSANARSNANVGGNAAANAEATTGVSSRTNVDLGAGANASGQGGWSGYGRSSERSGYSAPPRYYSSTPIRFGTGLTLCGTVKAGVFSGIKVGPCFAVSFRTESLHFEMESQLLIGGVRHSIDWVFPMSFVIPLTSQRSLYEGLQLRVGGSPIGATFAKSEDGGNYLRFGLHGGLSYELDLGPAASFRVFDVRAFLDFGTRRQVDLRENFIDFGAQLSTGIVF